MMRHVLTALVLATALAGCTSAKMLRINDAPVGLNARQQGDIGPVIERALSERGWQVSERRPGAVDAFIMVRDHRAEITVAYDADSYSLVYRDSQNLDHHGNFIHRNYNRWIANLNHDIQRLLAMQ